MDRQVVAIALPYKQVVWGAVECNAKFLKLLKPQAEKLKQSFGSALPNETHENEIISIPGIAGRDRKEISMRTLAHIINARMEEIFAQVYFEIKSSGYANSLNAGIVVTGGGSQLKWQV